MGKSTHAGFNGERAATPAAGDSPSSPLNPGRQQHLANAASAGCQGAVGTVAGSQESGWSHPGTAGSRPRRRHQPQGWHRALSPPGCCCLLFQAFLDCPAQPSASSGAWHVCLHRQHGLILPCPPRASCAHRDCREQPPGAPAGIFRSSNPHKNI